MSKRAPHPVHEPWPGSPQYWRSIEERGRLEDPAKMQQENAAEFPKGHFETPPTDEACLVSRRGLLGAMTATLALVGAEGCRRPIEKIVPYTKMPEDVIPGVPSHYATVIQRRGDAVGLLVESHEGRPDEDRRQRVAVVEPRRGGPGHPGHDPRPLRSRALDRAPQERERPAELGRLRGRALGEAGGVRQGSGRPAAGPDAADALADGASHARRPRAALPEGARPHVVGGQRQQPARRRADRVRRADQHPLRVRPRARHPVARQRLPPDRDAETSGRRKMFAVGPPPALRRTTR